MPRFDGTGPRGQGPRTGRGLGYCAPGAGGTGSKKLPNLDDFRTTIPPGGLLNPGLRAGGGFGSGLGRGRGGGRGFGRR